MSHVLCISEFISALGYLQNSVGCSDNIISIISPSPRVLVHHGKFIHKFCISCKIFRQTQYSFRQKWHLIGHLRFSLATRIAKYRKMYTFIN